MPDVLKKHRVIGIRHTIKELRDAGLVPAGTAYPEDAVAAIQKTIAKASRKQKPRTTRKDSSISSLVRKIEIRFKLPVGSVQLVYPSGRKAGDNATVGSWQRNWQKAIEDE
jgi:hypothetical protein